MLVILEGVRSLAAVLLLSLMPEPRGEKELSLLAEC